MIDFITRIELRDASIAQYELLHTAMARQGFSRTVITDTGKKLHLPWAEYYMQSVKTLAQVLESAKLAVGTTGVASYSVLVNRTTGWTSFGLLPA